MLFFSFFFIAQTSTETLEAHYNIPAMPTLFLFIKAIYFFPFLFLQNLTGRLWTSFFLIRRNLGSYYIVI